MTQITLTIKDPKEATLIRKLLAKFDSVTISKPKRTRTNALDEAFEDVAAGKVYKASSVEDLFLQLNTVLTS